MLLVTDQIWIPYIATQPDEPGPRPPRPPRPRRKDLTRSAQLSNTGHVDQSFLGDEPIAPVVQLRKDLRGCAAARRCATLRARHVQHNGSGVPLVPTRSQDESRGGDGTGRESGRAFQVVVLEWCDQHCAGMVFSRYSMADLERNDIKGKARFPNLTSEQCPSSAVDKPTRVQLARQTTSLHAPMQTELTSQKKQLTGHCHFFGKLTRFRQLLVNMDLVWPGLTV